MTTKNYTPIEDLIKQHKRQRVVSKPKEAEPILSAPEEYEIKEIVEHKPEKEARPFIYPRRETIELPPNLKKMGLQVVTSTKFPSYQTVVLPISDDKVLQGLHAPIYSSLRWLATLAWYILQKAHLTLKIIHGHVVRVVRG